MTDKLRDPEMAERIVREWQSLLKLDAWEIEVMPERGKHKPEPDEWEDSRYAFVWRARDYQQAELWLHPDWRSKKWSTFHLNVIIVHELIHLVTREVEYIINQIDGLMHRDVDKLIVQAHTHAIEGAVDALAYRFVEIGGTYE